MCSIPTAFDALRRAYRGATDSINDVDVDAHGGCVYAACSSGDVLVWDVATLQLKAQLRLSHWVNAVRCFPLTNSSASSSSGAASAAVPHSTMMRRSSPTAAGGGGGIGASLYADVRSHSEIRWVLTGSEDGVVAVWSPMTYRTQSLCRPSLAAITAFQLLPYTPSNANDNVGCATAPGDDGKARETGFSAADDAAFLCAASLQHIYVLKVSSATPELALLRSLQHSVLITTITPVCTATALPMPLLAVGQDDGTLCLWNCHDWLYHDTLPYPSGEGDVDDDARHSSAIHEPQFEHGAVLGTFAYNLRRCNPPGDGDVLPEAQTATPWVDGRVYQREMPGAVSADAAALVERHCGPLPPALQHVLQLAGQRGNLEGRDPVPLATTLHYDTRRITCLASSHGSSGGLHAQLYSGHATGEVLMWGCLKKGVGFLLLKKILLFRPGVWVWRICAVRPLVTSFRMDAAADGSASPSATGTKAKPKVLRGKAALTAKVNLSTATANPTSAASATSTVYTSPLELIVWSDGGSVQYVSTHNKQLSHREGPGFMASAATCWIGEGFPEAPDGVPAAVHRGGTTDPAAPSSTASVSAHQYVLMGNFEGRVERYDITKVMGLTKSFGKMHT